MAHKSTALSHELPDTKQSVWQLSAIQLSGWTSLPILATSVMILQKNSCYGALWTIVLGNILLWFIRLVIILMSHKKRQSTLDISRDYLGNFGSYFIGVLLLFSTLVWFIAQTTTASTAITHLVTINENPGIDKFTQVSVLLGVCSTLLCMEGIVLLRKLSMFTFPILLLILCIVMFTVPLEWPSGGSAAISFSGLGLVLGSNLGITSDLPTFFRHSKSLHTSIWALVVIQLISLALALCSLFLGSIISSSFTLNEQAIVNAGNGILSAALVIFIFLSVICANVANVYSASVGWEVIAPSALVGRKEYLILGLGLTTIFIMISNLFSVDFLLNNADSSLVNLCLVFITGYIVTRWTKRLPNAYEQKTYFLAWALATVATSFQYIYDGVDSLVPLGTGCLVIAALVLLSLLTKRFALQKAR